MCRSFVGREMLCSLTTLCTGAGHAQRFIASPFLLQPLLQIRSLDLSQNTFSEEDGDEMAVLAELTGLECLKLANCRMTQVRPQSTAG